MADLTIVLLPGLDGTGELFAPFVAQLPAWVRPIVVSYPRDRLLGYDALMEIVTTAIPADVPFAVVGESFSGPLAVRVGALGHAGLRGVILSASFVRRPVSKALALVIRPMLHGPMFAAVPNAVRALPLIGPRPTAELRRLIDHAVDDVPPWLLAGRLREVLRVDVRPALRRCGAPFLYLRGTNDHVVGARNVADVLAVKPDARVAEFDAAHCLLQSRPAEGASVIASFLQGSTTWRDSKP